MSQVYNCSLNALHKDDDDDDDGDRCINLGRLSFVQWRLLFVGPQYATSFVSPSKRLDFQKICEPMMTMMMLSHKLLQCLDESG